MSDVCYDHKENVKRSECEDCHAIEIEQVQRKIALDVAADSIIEKMDLEDFNNIFNGIRGHAEIYVANRQDQIKITDESGSGYVYMNGLWKKQKKSYFILDISLTLHGVILNLHSDYGKRPDHDRNKLFAIAKVLKSVNSPVHSKNVLEYVKQMIMDTEFTKKLNKTTNLLPIRNFKVIDLKTLEIRPRTREDLFDFEINCNFLGRKAPIKNAERFFNQIMKDDKEVVEYLQCNLGYCTTAEINQHCIYIFWGSGANGKSTLTELMSIIMGHMSIPVDKKLFIKSDSGGNHTAHLVPLIGARLGVFSESEKAEKINGGLVKTLTGGDKISCRALYGDQFEFKPCAKYIFLTNFRPSFDINDQAMLRRIKYVPFLAAFKERPQKGEYNVDHQFIEDLKSIYIDEVFSWLCIGAYKYYGYVARKEPIPIPKALEDAKNQYIFELDNVSQFLGENYIDCRKQSKRDIKATRIKRGDLYDDYKIWRQTNQDGDTVNQQQFFRSMDAKKYELIKSGGGQWFFYGLKKVDEMIE
jgi:putative DNA primase/helicase